MLAFFLLLSLVTGVRSDALELTGPVRVTANGSTETVIEGVRVLEASVNASVDFALPRAALTATRRSTEEDAADLPAGFGTGVSFKVRPLPLFLPLGSPLASFLFFSSPRYPLQEWDKG